MASKKKRVAAHAEAIEQRQDEGTTSCAERIFEERIEEVTHFIVGFYTSKQAN